MFNYEGEISYKQNKNVKNRRGGRKTQHQKQNQEIRQKKRHVRAKTALKYSNPVTYQQRKYRGLSIEDIDRRLKSKDFDFKNPYKLADISGKRVTIKEYKNFELNVDAYLEQVTGNKKPSQSNFKVGSRENWDQKHRTHLRK